MTNFNIGDTVYIIDDWTGLEKAEVLEFMFSGRVTKLKMMDEGKIRQVYTDKVFRSMEEIESYTEKVKNEYKEEIVDLKSLLQFMLDTDMNTCEYGDIIAREAVVERASELFGIELE